MNGISSHVYDYDDTTPKNYSHPTSPVASALFAYASANRVSGRDFMLAFILGFEAESRVANAVYPAHYDVGLAHHGHRRRLRRRDGDRPAARPDRCRKWCGRSAWRRRRPPDCARCSDRWARRFTRAGPPRTATWRRSLPKRASPRVNMASRARAASRRCRPRALRPLEDHGAVSASISICARTPTSRFRAAS